VELDDVSWSRFVSIASASRAGDNRQCVARVDAWSARPSMSSTLSPYMGKRSSRAWLFGRALHRALTPSLYSRLALVSSSTRR
jgi:hypothetical protein